MDTRSFSVLSLCSGIAGLDLGLKLTGIPFRTVCYVENEATVVEKLVARIEDGTLDDAPVWTDLKTFRGKDWRGKIHCLIAGYPCQPFSCAGKQKGAEDPRHLYPHVARIIWEVQPEWVFLENVSNHLRLGFLEVARSLRAMGYFFEAGLFTAAEVGAPHRRQRLFCLAHANRRGREVRRSEIAGALRHADDENARSAATRANGEVAVPTLRGRRELRQSSEGQRLANGRDARLADSGIGFLPLARRGAQGRNGTGSTGAELAHAESSNGGGRDEAQPQRTEIGRRGSGRNGERLAIAPSLGRAIRISERQNLRQESSAAAREGLPLFPPGPDDLKAWKAMLEIDPTLEPAFRGASDELPAGMDEQRSPRVDRLRALGNGVVPLTAAFAFRILLDRHAEKFGGRASSNSPACFKSGVDC